MLHNPQWKIIIWLLAGCFLIFSMVLIGGITRLTGSGLSITEWNVIMGAVPPLNATDWNLAFEKYKLSPQFRAVNFNMQLQEFKSIFWWEYVHRLVGRMTGLLFLIPFLYFLLKRELSPNLLRKLLLVFCLGAIQGFLGWYMVKSGLANNPHVSQYRLAMHLLTAFITYGLTWWISLTLLFPATDHSKELQYRPIKFAANIFLGITIFQIAYGALVAGLHAGKAFNTFPKMGEEWWPDAVTVMHPFWKNMSENLAGVQFIHRSLAWIMMLGGIGLYVWVRNEQRSPLQKRALNFFLGVLTLQFCLGIVTLLFAAPILLSVLHQTGGFLLFSAVIFLKFSFTFRQSLNSSLAA
jgi:cytochrome c oxidase assembly protein subunit 15